MKFSLVAKFSLCLLLIISLTKQSTDDNFQENEEQVSDNTNLNDQDDISIEEPTQDSRRHVEQVQSDITPEEALRTESTLRDDQKFELSSLACLSMYSYFNDLKGEVMQRASQAISKLQADQQTKSLIVEKYVLHSITNCVYTMLKESSEETKVNRD